MKLFLCTSAATRTHLTKLTSQGLNRSLGIARLGPLCTVSSVVWLIWLVVWRLALLLCLELMLADEAGGEELAPCSWLLLLSDVCRFSGETVVTVVGVGLTGGVLTSFRWVGLRVDGLMIWSSG